MENATKALIIAASVLVAILLIAFGMKVFKSTSGTAKTAQSTMDATAIAQFNSQFAGYNGKKYGSSKINDLVQKVIASNATNSRKITVNTKDPATEGYTLPAGNEKKIITITYTAGYITDISY